MSDFEFETILNDIEKATFGGTFILVLDSSVTFDDGDTFTLFTYGSHVGQFDSV